MTSTERPVGVYPGDLGLFGIPVAAERLGLAESTIRHQIRNGKIDAARWGRDWYVTGEEIERYRRDHKRKDAA